MYFTVFIIFITYFIIHYFAKFSFWKRKGIKGPVPLPIFGNVLENFIWSVNKIEEYRYKNYNSVYGIYVGTYPILMISDPALAKIVTTTSFNNFSDINIFKNSQTIFKHSYIFKKGQHWKDGRILISPNFSKRKVKDIFSKILEAALVSVNNVENIINLGKQNEVDIKNITKCYSLDVIAKFVFAVEINSFVDKEHPFVLNGKKITTFSKLRLALFTILPNKIIKLLKISVLDTDGLNYLSSLCNSIIKQRRENKDKKYNDFLDELISTIDEKNLNVPLKEIIAHCLIFFFAGMGTVSMTLSNTLYFLATNKDWQKKLFEELKNLYLSKEITFDNLNNSLILDSCIKESMRIYPILNRIARVAENKCNINHIKVDAGQIVGVNIYTMHHSSELWDEPEKFKPDRFFEEGFMSKINDYYMPFGAGPRTCVGMRLALAQVKCLLINLILSYEISPTSKTSIPPRFTKNANALIYNELFLGFEKRV